MTAPILPILAIIFAALAALLHVYIWVMESVTWARPATWKRFGIRSQDEADTIKPMALNQGFYNLFLAIGVTVGLVLLSNDDRSVAQALIIFACASMVAAALVLVISNPRLARAALLQGFFPLLAVVFFVIADATTNYLGAISN